MIETRKSFRRVVQLSGFLCAVGAAVFLLGYLSWYRFILWAVVCLAVPLAVVIINGWTEEDL